MPFIDLLKACASQLIVLHHLVIYGPLSEAMADVMPALVAWIAEYGRLAVPVFLAAAGFLSARGLAPGGVPTRVQPLTLIARRYMRLAIPYLVAVTCALACAAVARTWMHDDATPAIPTIRQFLAHVFLLHSLLGYDSLSAGVWYVAVDFQLYALMVGLVWLAHSGRGAASPTQRLMMLVAAAAAASLLYFNLDQDWDSWGLYFFGSYALGAFAYWAAGRSSHGWLVLLAAAGTLVLVVDFRVRIAVALIASLSMALACRHALFQRISPTGIVVFLSKISYSTFLIHYPISLVFNTLFANVAGHQPALAVTTFVLTWATSIGAGTLLHRYVEDGPVFAVRRPVPA